MDAEVRARRVLMETSAPPEGAHAELSTWVPLGVDLHALTSRGSATLRDYQTRSATMARRSSARPFASLREKVA